MTNLPEISLKNALDLASPLYILPEEPVIEDVLIPATKKTSTWILALIVLHQLLVQGLMYQNISSDMYFRTIAIFMQ